MAGISHSTRGDMCTVRTYVHMKHNNYGRAIYLVWHVRMHAIEFVHIKYSKDKEDLIPKITSCIKEMISIIALSD